MKKTLLFAAAMLSAATMIADDDLGYTPLEGDIEVTIPACSGKYVNNAFSISLYGTPLDPMGFVAGAGDLVNLEFYTEDPASEKFSIAGVYKFYDTQAWMDQTTDVRFGPGDLMGGFLYEMMPGYFFPMGSLVTVYDEDLNETLGLVGPGSTLTVTSKGGGVYNLSLDFYTQQNAHITGEWEGVLADYVEDCPIASGISDVAAPDVQAEYYTLQGHRVQNPQKGGIYIERRGTTVTKILK